MYRLAIKKLKEWKNKEDRKPMILMGGKTGRKNLDHERIWQKRICESRIYIIL